MKQVNSSIQNYWNEYDRYLKDYVELWVYFCYHKKETPKQITDEVLFKQEFTYDRWKKGFSDYKHNKPIKYEIDNELDGIKLRTQITQLTYNLYRFIPFNIRYKNLFNEL